MMEVKQNTPTDFNNLITSNSNGKSDELDVMASLSTAKIKNDLLGASELSQNGLLSAVTNGSDGFNDAAEALDLDEYIDLNEPVNAELEDVLLGDDGATVVDKLLAEVVPKAVDIIGSDPVAGVTDGGLSKSRNPGDDLDTLLSKINDLKDCIETEAAPSLTNTTTVEKNKETKQSVEGKAKSASAIAEEKVESPLAVAAENVEEASIQSADLKADTPAEGAVADTKKTLEAAAATADEVSVEKSTASKEVLNEKSTTTKVDTPSADQEVPTVTLDDSFDDVISATEQKSVKTSTETATESKDDTKTDDLAAEDSDDDVIFFVDKSDDSIKQSDKSEEVEVKENTIEAEGDTDEKSSTKPAEKLPNTTLDDDDDDVVLLDDDEEEKLSEPTPATETTNKSEEIKDSVNSKADKVEDVKVNAVEKSAEGKENAESGKKSQMDIDNSDNACDKYEGEKAKVAAANKEEVKAKSVDCTDETSSNCSSSSNLLQETQTASSLGVVEEEEADAPENENDDEEDVEAVQEADDESAIELLEDESQADTDKVTSSAPPAKRLRLSQEGEESGKPASTDETPSAEQNKIGTSSNEEKVVNTTQLAKDDTEMKDTSSSTSIKRSHESLDLNGTEESGVESAEVATKKLKTEEKAAEEKSEQKVDNATAPEVVKNEDTLKQELDCSSDVKETLKWRPIASDIPIPLYPAPKFEPTIPKLSLDFFKRFRKTFDKMTKTDLEELVLQKVVEAIVHKSEFAEMRDLIERQEKQIVAHRTKISELSKQFRDLEMVHNRVQKDLEAKNSQVVMPVKITRAVGLQVFIPTKRNSEALSGSAHNSAGGAQQTSTPSSPQRGSAQMPPPSSPPRHGSIDTRTSGTVLASAAAAAAMNARRGCAQKVTPQRPALEGGMSNPATPPATGGPYRGVLQAALTQGSPNTAQQQSLPRVLNKGVAMQRNRFASPATVDPQYQSKVQQHQIPRPPQMQNTAVRKLLPKQTASGNVVSQQNQFRRPEPVNTAPNPAVDIYMNSLNNQMPPTTGSISITPAKPKEKAVIDLTDEDEVAAAAAASNVRQRIVTANANNVSPVAQFASNRSVPPLARMPPAQTTVSKTQIARQQLTTIHTQKTNGSTLLSNITTPPGTSITRVHINPTNIAVQRTKYGHPAPLPSTPPQPYKVGWKDPPPRPTIRISNLENGIVISWTMEEAMDHHADCVSYQIYAYQETNGPPAVDSWRHVGDVKAMLLPMAVTLTQFQEGQRYYFAVRAVDVYQRFGPFSIPKTWS